MTPSHVMSSSLSFLEILFETHRSSLHPYDSTAKVWVQSVFWSYYSILHYLKTPLAFVFLLFIMHIPSLQQFWLLSFAFIDKSHSRLLVADSDVFNRSVMSYYIFVYWELIFRSILWFSLYNRFHFCWMCFFVDANSAKSSAKAKFSNFDVNRH